MSQITIAIVMLGEREGGGFSLLLHSTVKYCTDWLSFLGDSFFFSES
jgi:hypothetical protein